MNEAAVAALLQVQLFPDGSLTVSRESSDDTREGTFITDILPKIKGTLCPLQLTPLHRSK